jgi:two-component system sensor histidine kinase DctS
VAPNPQAASHAIAFDPPGNGLTLTVTRFDSRTSLTANALVATIIVFSLLALASLVVTRRHMIRRGVAELALQEEHALRKAMEESLTVGMRARDHSGKIIYVNQAFCRMVGWPAEELVGCAPPMPYWLPEDMERTLELHQLVLDGKAPPEGFEIKFHARSGERFDALVYEAPLIDAEGHHRGWMGSVVDATTESALRIIAPANREAFNCASRDHGGDGINPRPRTQPAPCGDLKLCDGSMKWLLEGEGEPRRVACGFRQTFPYGPKGRTDHPPGARIRAQNEPHAANLEELVSGTLEFVAPELRPRHCC